MGGEARMLRRLFSNPNQSIGAGARGATWRRAKQYAELSLVRRSAYYFPHCVICPDGRTVVNTPDFQSDQGTSSSDTSVS